MIGNQIYLEKLIAGTHQKSNYPLTNSPSSMISCPKDTPYNKSKTITKSAEENPFPKKNNSMYPSLTECLHQIKIKIRNKRFLTQFQKNKKKKNINLIRRLSIIKACQEQKSSNRRSLLINEKMLQYSSTAQKKPQFLTIQITCGCCRPWTQRLLYHYQGYSYLIEPMDLKTVQQNLLRGQYQTKNQFIADVNKIWLNAYKYNIKDSQVYKTTTHMQKYFNSQLNQEPYKNSIPSIKKIKKSNNKPKKYVLENIDIPMNIAEKRQLGQNIRKLPPEYLKGIWQIVSDNANKPGEIIEFDINTLPVRKTRQLQKYVKNKLQQLNKKKKTIKENKEQQHRLNSDKFNAQSQQKEDKNIESSFVIDSDTN